MAVAGRSDWTMYRHRMAASTGSRTHKSMRIVRSRCLLEGCAIEFGGLSPVVRRCMSDVLQALAFTAPLLPSLYSWLSHSNQPLFPAQLFNTHHVKHSLTRTSKLLPLF